MAGPVAGYELDGKIGKINPWYYDASSTNRHNDGGVDIWAEIIIGRKTNILSNWQQ